MSMPDQARTWKRPSEIVQIVHTLDVGISIRLVSYELKDVTTVMFLIALRLIPEDSDERNRGCLASNVLVLFTRIGELQHVLARTCKI